MPDEIEEGVYFYDLHPNNHVSHIGNAIVGPETFWRSKTWQFIVRVAEGTIGIAAMIYCHYDYLVVSFFWLTRVIEI